MTYRPLLAKPAAFFSAAVPMPKQDMTVPVEESTSTPFKKQNIFTNRENLNMSKTYGTFDIEKEFGAKNHGLNVGLAAFYSLPKIEKTEGEAIMQELRSDMDEQWTPSKLVAELDKHIVS